MSGERKTGSRRATVDEGAAAAREMVAIDQEPVRKAAGAECSAAMARLEKTRAAWHRFEREDKPAFVRWRAREFGPLLSQLRDVEVQIRDSEALVHEVEMEMRRGFYDPHTAYQRVMFRRANPSAVQEETPPPRERQRAGEDRAMSDFEKEALFQEWVQKFMGTNPDKLDDDAYTTSFEAFKSHMFRSRPADLPPSDNFRRAEKERRSAHADEQTVKPPATDARVKELYRLLVRRLHRVRRAGCLGSHGEVEVASDFTERAMATLHARSRRWRCEWGQAPRHPGEGWLVGTAAVTRRRSRLEEARRHLREGRRADVRLRCQWRRPQ